MQLAIRSGGHTYAGYSTTPASSSTSAHELEPRRERLHGIVTIGAGTKLIDVESALAPSDATIPSGSCPTVGLGGLALGGGKGLACREFGLTCDNVPRSGS